MSGKNVTKLIQTAAALLICLITVSPAVTAFAEESTVKSVKLSFAGDCSIGKLQVHGYEGTFDQYYDTYGAAYFFKNVKPVFDEDDLTIVNFEGVLTDSDDRVPKEWNIKGRPEFINVLTGSGIDAVSFANNHKIDYGQKGIEDTVQLFESISMPYAYDDITATVETADGIRVGITAANFVIDAEDVSGGMKYLQNGIEKLKSENADIIVAFVHWGTEGTHYPDAEQMNIAHFCAENGADIVVGSHAHVLQGFECYKGVPIFYGLGNFCFGGNRNPSYKDSLIAQVTVELEEEKTAGSLKGTYRLKTGGNENVDSAESRIISRKVHIIPARISSVSTRNDYCPVIASGKQYSDIIDQMNAYSAQFGAAFDEKGDLK